MALYYNNLDTISHTLREFVQRSTNIWENEGRSSEQYVNFTLSGAYVDEARVKQAFVDPLRNRVQDAGGIGALRDYDSALGVCDDILVQAPISVYTIPHPSHCLSKDIRITRDVVVRHTTYKVPLHKITNFEFGTVGNRHHLNLFFPGLYEPEEPARALTKTERAQFYDLGMRPAILHLLGPEVAGQWPATFETEMHRAKKHKGGHTWGTHLIPQQCVGALLDTIRDMLSRAARDGEPVEWACGIFALHTIRGTKHSSYHTPAVEDSENALKTFFKDASIPEYALEFGDWHMDVGLEFSSPGLCLQWTTEGHMPVVQQALGLEDDKAHRITRLGSGGYSRDMVSHLPAISGFRITPGVQAQGEFKAKYIQAYTTDKSVVYHPENGHHAKFLDYQGALGSLQPPEIIKGLNEIYSEAMGKNASNARLEVRVPLRFATQVLLSLDNHVMATALCSFRMDEWWGFRVVRLMGMSQVLTLQESATEGRFVDGALTLTAACIWMVNGLHARPDEGQSSKDLMSCALPLAEADEVNFEIAAWRVPRNSGDLVPYNPYGCVFLRRIKIADAPRLRGTGPTLSPAAIKFFFGGKSVSELKRKYSTVGIVAPNTRRFNNKKSPPLFTDLHGTEQPNLFNIGNDRRNPIVLVDENDDGSDEEDHLPRPHQPVDLTDPDAFLTYVWNQFLVDVKNKSPNRVSRHAASYLNMSLDDRNNADDTIFRTLSIPQSFDVFYWAVATDKQWRTAFGWLFPGAGFIFVAKGVQHYPTCDYFREWLKFLSRHDKKREVIEKLRSALFKKVSEWCWIPFAQSNRMWDTGSKRENMLHRFKRYPDEPIRNPAPIIWLRPGSSRHPIFD